MDIWKELGTLSIITFGIIWLAKAVSKHLLDQNLKSHELVLNQKLEQYKSELRVTAEKESKLHDKRLDKIHELYSLLTDFYFDLDNLTRGKNVTGMSTEEIEMQNAQDVKCTYAHGYELSIFYEKNKLYFNDETCGLIEEILKTLKGCQYDLTFQYQWMNISVDLQIESFKNARNQIQNKVPMLKKELEKNFRSILKVE